MRSLSDPQIRFHPIDPQNSAIVLLCVGIIYNVEQTPREQREAGKEGLASGLARGLPFGSSREEIRKWF